MLSRESRAEPLGVPGLRELPVRIDWSRLGPAELARRLAAAVASGEPVGVMFHHAEMDEPRWRGPMSCWGCWPGTRASWRGR